MTLREKLTAIQSELKAPKTGYNTFGKYKYRSFEQICEAAKPVLAKNRCSLILKDTIEQIGERYYVVAIAELLDDESDASIKVTAYAREASDKKGMDDSQVTGTASSYARKYACNGLFLIDDTKDADTDEYHEQTHQDEQRAKPAQIRKLIDDAAAKGVSAEMLLSRVSVDNIEELTNGMVSRLADMVARSKGVQ